MTEDSAPKTEPAASRQPPPQEQSSRGPVEWAKAQWHAFFLKVDTKSAFPESTDELKEQLKTDDVNLAADLLAEAQSSYDRLNERVEGAERRATTLQGAAAIAAGLTLTAAGLLVDSTKLHGRGWQLSFGLALVYVTFALVMCAWRATLATSRVFVWVTPPDRAILDRVGEGIAQARVDRAAALLHCIGENQRFARYKVAMMRAATEWLVRALVALLVVALLAAAYALFGPQGKPAPAAEVTVVSRAASGAPSLNPLLLPPFAFPPHKRGPRR